MLTSYTLYMYRFTLQQSTNTDSLWINEEVLPDWHLIHKYIHCYQDVSDFAYSGYKPKQTPELFFYFNRDLFLKCNVYFSIQPTKFQDHKTSVSEHKYAVMPNLVRLCGFHMSQCLHILEGKGFCYVADNVTYVNANRHETGLQCCFFFQE